VRPLKKVEGKRSYPADVRMASIEREKSSTVLMQPKRPANIDFSMARKSEWLMSRRFFMSVALQHQGEGNERISWCSFRAGKTRRD
jgi:hypothetical protein